MSMRAEALASRILQGADALATYADQLDEGEWARAVPVGGRSVGVVVHHVASLYPIEVQLAQALASGNPITGVTWAGVADMNAQHATDHAGVGKAETIQLLRDNAAGAAAEVGRLSDTELDTAASVSLNGDAPLTTQFFIEDHALRHSFHHLAKIRDALAS